MADKYHLLFRTQQRLALRGDILGGEYAVAFLRAVDEAIEREFASVEAKRKADNEARFKKMKALAHA